MKFKNNWRERAVCATDKFSHKWTSYKKEDIEYARLGCVMCPVKKECLITALNNDSFVGMIAGISEFEYLMHTWSEVKEENESNWRRDDSTLSKLLREIP